jgi:carboxymethylenebutenolidase
VIVVQEAFGVNEHIEDVCARLADAGWLAIAPHLFHRTGDPQLGYDDFALVAPHFSAVSAETIFEDVDVALGRAAAAGFEPERIGVVGFCMGGTVALATAVERPVGAAVTFYGGGVTKGRFGLPSLVELAPRLTVPWLGLYGDLDTGIPVEDVEALRAAAASSSASTEVVRYPEAAHGFNCDRRASFHAASAADAWQRMLDFFDANLSARE